MAAAAETASILQLLHDYYVPDLRSLRRCRRTAAPAGACWRGATTRLRPFLHPAEYPVTNWIQNLADCRMRLGPGSRRGRHPRPSGPRANQTPATRHLRSMGRRGDGRSRIPRIGPRCCGNITRLHPGILVSLAAQVQIRHHASRARTARDP